MPTQDPPRQPSQTEVPSAVIGARLRDARERRSLTLREVVDASEGNFQIATLSAWERGERRIGLASLMWLAEHYGIPVGDLLHPRSAPDGDPVIVVHRGRLAEAAPYWDPLKTLVQRTIDARHDPSGDTVRLRGEDVELLATVLDLTVPALVQRLVATDLADTSERG